MSLRPHGRTTISPSSPRARGVCDRCGFMFNHKDLRWQYDWRGTKLQNLRFLVCESCQDKYQQSGQRTIILPPDPVPIMNARPEYYVSDDNPISAIGANPTPARWSYSNQIGTMINQAGVPAAFDGNTTKRSFQSASITVSDSSYGSYVGLNWSGSPQVPTPSGLSLATITHSLSSYQLYAPVDRSFGSSAYLIQGSSVGGAFSNWTTLASGVTAGSNGEHITGTPSGAAYQYHRVAFLGNGASPIYLAQVQFSVSDGGQT